MGSGNEIELAAQKARLAGQALVQARERFKADPRAFEDLDAAEQAFQDALKAFNELMDVSHASE